MTVTHQDAAAPRTATTTTQTTTRLESSGADSGSAIQTVAGDTFESSRTSLFASANVAAAGKENSWDLEALQELVRLLEQERIGALPSSRDYVDLELVSESFGSNKSRGRELFLEVMAARNQHIENAASDPQAVIDHLLRNMAGSAIQDPSRVVRLLEASKGDPEAAVAALNREFPTGWKVVGSGRDMKVAYQGNNQSWPSPVQVHYQRHGVDSYRVTIGGHGKDGRAHAFSMIVSEGGEAHVLAPQRLDYSSRGLSTADALDGLSRAIADQAPTMSLDEQALRQTRPELAQTLDQTVYIYGREMRLGDAIELKLQQSARWAVENHLEPAAMRESPKDPRWAILSAMANHYLPGKFPGRSGLVTQFFEGRAAQLDQEMDELAAMIGEPPFQLREAVEQADAILTDGLDEAFDGARGSDRELRQLRDFAMARGWQLAADSMPGEQDGGGKVAAILSLFGVER